MQFIQLSSVDRPKDRWGSKILGLYNCMRSGIPVPDVWVLDGRDIGEILSNAGILPGDQRVPLEAAGGVYEKLADVPEDFYHDVVEQVRRLLSAKGSRGPWVVRSSNPYEDSAANSFAGLFHTEVNLTDAGDIANAICRCVREGFVKGVIDYCRIVGVDDIMPCSVMVQRLVPAQASGVAFMGDEEFDVQANWGLGQSVVDGLCTPDGWCAKTGGEISFALGDKEEAVVALYTRNLPWAGDDIACADLPNRARATVLRISEANRAAVVSLPDELTQAPCLSDRDVEDLRAICDSVRSAIRCPEVDIEWCKARDGALHIVQARPQTREVLKTAGVRAAGQADPLVGGVVEGPAQLVEGEGDARVFRRGSILVAQMLKGPSLSAVQRAAGCLIGVRSKLSHSAIIARELGLPTVGGVDIRSIKAGARYVVDGSKGSFGLSKGPAASASSQRQESRFPSTPGLLDLRPLVSVMATIPPELREGVALVDFWSDFREVARYDLREYCDADVSEDDLRSLVGLIEQSIGPEGAVLVGEPGRLADGIIHNCRELGLIVAIDAEVVENGQAMVSV